MNKIRANINTTPQPNRNFKLVQLETTTPAFGGRPVTNTVAISADGKVEVRQAHSFAPGGVPTTTTGQASEREMRELENAVKLANMETVPDPLNVVIPMYVIAQPFRLVVKSDDSRHEGQTSGQFGYYGQYDARLRPLIDLANRIMARIQNPSSARNFLLVQLESTTHVIGGRPVTNTVAITDDGKVEVRQAHFLAPGGVPTTKTGTATDAEMTELENAVKLANMETIPDPVGPRFLRATGPRGRIIFPANRFLLTVKSNDSRHEGQTRGSQGMYGQYEARLKPLIDLVKRIGARVNRQPTSSAFTKITRNIFRPSPIMRPLRADPSIEVLWGTSETFELDSDGTARFTWSAPNIRTRPITGKATRQELRDLNAAINRARLASIPSHLPQPIHIVAAPTFELKVDAPVSTNHATIDGELGYYSQWDSQLRPVMDVLDRIVERLRSGDRPTRSAFTKITRNIFRPSPIMRPLRADPSIEVLWGTSETFELDSDGTARFTWSAPNVRTRPINGKATRQELRDLNAAINRARLASIPSHLPQPIHIVAAPTFELKVDAPVSTNHATIDGELGYYSQWDSQLRPVMDVLDRIVERLRSGDQPTRNEAKGEVEVRGYYGFRTVWLVESDTMAYEVKPWSFARKLMKFEGHQVKVKGEVKDTAEGEAEIKATDLISPVRQDLSGNCVVNGDEASIDTGGPIFWALRDDPNFEGPLPGPRPDPSDPTFEGPLPGPWMPHPPFPSRMIETFGPAAAVLTKAADTWVTVDAWVFKDANGTAFDAYVVAVRAKAKVDSDLTRWGSKVNSVREGEEILLTRLSRSGNHVLAQPNSGRAGYLRVTDANMGGMRLYTLPMDPPIALDADGSSTATPAPTNGLSSLGQ